MRLIKELELNRHIETNINIVTLRFWYTISRNKQLNCDYQKHYNIGTLVYNFLRDVRDFKFM